jgi:hypothetical protein
MLWLFAFINTVKMDVYMYDKTYKDAVEADFKTRGFTEASFKDKNHWYEILDADWNWDEFDYRIPVYDKSKSSDEIQSDVTNFVTSFGF